MYLKFSRLLSDLLLIAGMLCCSVSIFSCGDDSDTVELPIPEGETLSVALTIDFSNEADGYALSTATHTRGMADGQNASFEAKLNTVSLTRSSGLFPTDLYNLEIRQYDQNGQYLNGQSLGTTTIGSKITVPLTATKENEDCQLLIVARGSSGAVPELGTKTLSTVQKSIIASSSIISSIDPSSDMNTMPYFLYLPHVKVTRDANTGYGTIQSAENGTEDVRLRLKRLAVRMSLNWSLSEAMKTQGYELKEVKLCQVPSTYYLLPEREKTSEWGITYPSTVSEFVDVYRLTGTGLTTANGSKSVWIPANVRGTSSAFTSPIHRTKENAPTAASYAEIVVDNTVKKERLYYRAYLGGNDPSDFNLNENTDYNWTLNIKSADYAGDPRIELLDQTPVQSENLVPTANCLMLQPGGNLCFNPYQHTSGTNGWNDYLVNNSSTSSPSAKTAITSVKILWQTKDAGTSGDLVLGYIIDDTHHENLANITNADNINQARVSVKAPVTNGGNAVIAAYNGNTILWSWHIWVTDYMPVVASGNITDDTSRRTAIAAAQSATKGGMVHAYDGYAWTNSGGAFYQKVIMDRHLGATRNTYSTGSTMDAARAYGMLYQWGRKDPIPGSLDGTATEVDVLYDGYGVAKRVIKGGSNSLSYTVENPLTFCTGLYMPNNSWGGSASKTIYDPCPDGWRVPDFLNTDSRNILKGFEAKNGGNVKILVANKWQETSFTISESNFAVSNGFLYNSSVWLPIVRMRETSGALRDPYSGGNFDSRLVPSFVMWGASASSSYGYYYEAKNGMASPTPSASVSTKTYGFSVRCIQE